MTTTYLLIKDLFTVGCCLIIFIFGTPNLFAEESHSREEYRLSLELGDQFFFSREVPGNAKKAMEYYSNALAIQPKSGEAAWKMARTLCSENRYEADLENRKQRLLRAIPWAENAVQWMPDQGISHFWLGSCYLEYSLASRDWKALRYAYAIKREMDIVLNINPQYAEAYHVLGTFYYYLPWLLGGSKEKGVELLSQAIEYQPNHTVHYIRLAQMLLEQGNLKEATPLLKKMFLIQDPYDPSLSFEDRIFSKTLVHQYQLELEDPQE
ncbi:hypothetical protein WDW89_16340 [Deltaproteobacteria bacterium TL4]